MTVDSDLIGSVMFSNQRVEKFDDRQPEFLQDLADNPRVRQIRGKIRTPTHEGRPVPKMKAFNVRDAIFEAMLHRLAIDPTMVAFGEENRKLLLASDAVERGSVMQTVATTLTQLCFDDLDGPPVVVGSRNWITPAAEPESMFFPQPGWLLDAIHERILPLEGYEPSTNQTLAETVRRANLGV